MALITWSDKVAVGNLEIDSQHKTLFSMMNELHEAMSAGKNEVTKRILDGLVKYTISHFTMEQGLMTKHPYPKEAMHREAHRLFILQIEKFQKEVNERTLTTTINLASFLKDWLVNHIQVIDKEFAAHLQSKGIK